MLSPDTGESHISQGGWNSVLGTLFSSNYLCDPKCTILKDKSQW